MKISRLLALSLLLFLAFAPASLAAAPAPIVTPYFTVTAPAGWEVDREADTKVTFVKGPNIFDEMYISINSVKMKKQISIEGAWEMLKPEYLTERAKKAYDGEEAVGGVAWKKIIYTEKVADIDMRRMVLFTMKDGKSFIVQVGSPDKRWDECQTQATAAIKTIKFKSK